MQDYYPELSSSSHYAELYLGGVLTQTWCGAEGWTQILMNENQVDVSSLTQSDYETAGLLQLPHTQMLPLQTIASITASGRYEMRVELTDSSSNQHYDSYASFSVSASDFAITLGDKKGSSASLASFDLSSVIQGALFQAQSSSCFSSTQTGSWYSNTCEGFALLGSQARMFYGPLSSTITQAKILIRETLCISWSEVSGVYICTQCESGYLPNSSGECITCPDQALCDVSSCSDLSAFLSDQSPSATCLLTSSCDLEAFPAANCGDPQPPPDPDPPEPDPPEPEQPNPSTDDSSSSDNSNQTTVAETTTDSARFYNQSQFIEMAGRATEGAIAATSMSAFVYKISTGMPIDSLWTLINSMQLMSFLKFINCSRLPSNFIYFINFLDFTLGQVAFVGYLPNLLRIAVPLNFTHYEQQEKSRFNNPFLNDSKIQQSSFFLNYELKLLFFLYLSLPIFLLLLARSLTRNHKKVHTVFTKCASCALFWRMSISLFMELAFLALLSLSQISVQNSLDALNLFFLITSFTFLLLLPITVLACLLRQRHYLNQKKNAPWKGKFITYNLNLEKRTTARLMYPVFIYLQRMLYASALIFLSTRSYLQMGACISLFSLVAIFLILVKPLKSRLLTCLTLLNELVLLLLILLFVIFQFIAQTMNDETLSILGAIMILALIICFLANIAPLLFQILFSILKPICKKLRKKPAKRSALKYIQNMRVHPESGTDFSVSIALQNNFMEKKILRTHQNYQRQCKEDIERIPSF